MKRIILCSLSAAVALTTSAVARADMSPSGSSTTPDPTEGVISPNEAGPNNRAVPGAGVVGSEANGMDTQDATQTGGVISPDPTGPNNRAVPGAGALGDGASAPDVWGQSYPTRTNGIISPDDVGPNNRAIPG